MLDEQIYWELMNNEICSVKDDRSNGSIIVATKFRSIRNALVFENAKWYEDSIDLVGMKLTYVCVVNPDTLSEEEKSRISEKSGIGFESGNTIGRGSKLYKIVTAEEDVTCFVEATDLSIVING